MKKIPKEIGGAKVILFTPIDGRHRYTGKTEHLVAGEVMGPASGIAICQYEGEDAFYLFGCDDNWESVTDTWHETLDEAKAQAEFEYEGVAGTWKKPSNADLHCIHRPTCE